MTNRVSFAEAVGAVSPLGDAIDGSPRRRGARPRKPRREPLGRSLTYFCSNPQCDHATWAPQEQAQHMAREFWEAAQAIVRLAPESPEALKLTGGVILREMTDNDCRAANAAYQRGERTIAIWLGTREYMRRWRAGELIEPPSPKPPEETCKRGHPFTPENTVQQRGGRTCRTCKRETDQKLRASKPEWYVAARARERERHRERMATDPEYRERRKTQEAQAATRKKAKREAASASS